MLVLQPIGAHGKLMLTSPSPELGSTELFLAGGHPYTVDDAIASAIFRGALDGAIEETLALAAAEKQAAEQGLEPGEQALQGSSESFRYKHDLISAGETEEWLGSRGLTTDDFSAWLYQRLCKELIVPAKPSSTESTIPDDFPELLRIHLWLSDQMDELAEQLSQRVAADLEMSASGEELSTESVLKRFLERQRLDEGTLPDWLAALGRDRSWLADTLRTEAAFERMGSLAVTEETRTRKLSSMQLSLARIEIETLDLQSEAAAREAFLCVRDDGTSLAEVALDAGYRAERAEMWMDMLDDTLGHRLLSAAEGEVIGPVQRDGRFKVYQVLRKVRPSVNDPAVARRLDERIVDEFFGDLCSRHIRARDVVRTAK
jgi:hypothetical protein